MIKLTYLFHSGYMIETAQCVLVFDYFLDSAHQGKGYLHDYLATCQKPVYVFASHFHADHYSPEVLTWKTLYPQVTFHYLFSNDIRRRKRLSKEVAVFLRRGEEYTDSLLHVKAYGSTDAGVSFCVQTAGKTVFHAGDLNNWHWKDESTPDEIQKSEQAYARELEYIAKDHTFFDIAMFPVDPRLGTDYAKGAVQFIETFRVAIFCPMHFGMEYYVADALEREVLGKCHVIHWTARGQHIEIDSKNTTSKIE